MKNIFGTTEELKLKDENGVLRYYFEFSLDTYREYIYNSNGKLLKHKNSNGYWSKRTYDLMCNQLKFKNSDGYCSKSTYDSNGKELTYENSYETKRCFDTPEVHNGRTNK